MGASRMKSFLLLLALGALLAGCKQQQIDPVKIAPPIPAAPHKDKPVEVPPVQQSANVTEEDLGIPFYPGSQPIPKLSSDMETPKSRTVLSGRTTKDDYKKVADFYYKKLTKAHKGELGHEGMLVDGQIKDGSMIQIQIMKSGPQTQIQVTSFRAPRKK